MGVGARASASVEQLPLAAAAVSGDDALVE